LINLIYSAKIKTKGGELMYQITNVKKVSGSAGFCPVGKFNSSEFQTATIFISQYGMPTNRIALNHNVLREALLNSPDILKDIGLVVKEIKPKVKKNGK
jgi:hypothetical protein